MGGICVYEAELSWRTRPPALPGPVSWVAAAAAAAAVARPPPLLGSCATHLARCCLSEGVMDRRTTRRDTGATRPADLESVS